MKRLIVTATSVLVASLVLAGSALAAGGGGHASGWHIGYYTPSPHGTLSYAEAPSAAPNGIASLNFTSQDNTALLMTDQKAQNPTLLGDLTGKTITASFTISGATGAFTYQGEPDGSGAPATARLYFQTSNAGGFDYTHYWWANPDHAVLTTNGVLTVTATVEPAEWSDWNGQSGLTEPAGFAAAASDVTEIGLSFGGGYFFENGVGTTDGSGTLTLNSFSAG